MGYDIEIRLANKNGWYTPDEARRYYGKYARDGFTVHWWNSPDRIADSDHDNIVNYMLSNATRGVAPTVNYVLSNHKITLVVNPDNVAWASGNGNATTVSCEFSPHLNDEGYKKAGWLLNELEGRYGKVLRLYRHSDWMTTQCPGTLSPDRIRQEADKWKRGEYNPKPAPAPAPAPAPNEPNLTWHLWKEGPQEYVPNKQPTHLYNVDTTTWGGIKVVKPFDKGLVDGKPIVIIGHIHNKALNRDYYITPYTFEKKATNGFHPADLDVYVPPRPLPEPVPTPDPNPPVPEAPEPVEPDRNAIIAFLVMMVAKLSEMLKAATDLLGRFKR